MHDTFVDAAFTHTRSIIETLCCNGCMHWLKYFPKPFFIFQLAVAPNPNEVLTLYSDLILGEKHTLFQDLFFAELNIQTKGHWVCAKL